MKFKLKMSESVFHRKDEYNPYIHLGFKFKKFKYHNCYFLDTNIVPVIEIETLDGLMNFVGRWKRIILTDDEIEIYNGYRE